MYIKFLNLSAMIICLPLIGCGPSNFNDCVLQNLKGVNNEEVMKAILIACRHKFPQAKELP